MPNFIGVRHVGLEGKNLATLAEFYRDVMGMTIVRESPADSPFGASLFLSAHPEEEDHEVVFFQTNPLLAHTAFKVASLGELLTFYRQMKERGLPIKFTLNHGTSFSFYFDDPEGHMIEVYWPTNVLVPPSLSYAYPIDFDEEVLQRELESMTRQFGLSTASTLK